MKNSKLYIIGIAGLAIGFAIAWYFKPDQEMIRTDKAENISEDVIWTCSMHTQIRRSESGQCPICEMDLIPLENSENSSPHQLEMTEEAVQLANIQTSIVRGGENGSKSTLKLNGKIEADETRSASIVSHIPGRIEKLFVSSLGEKVRKGQRIAMIYSPDLITAQKELIEVSKIQDLSPSLLEASKNKLRNWKITDGQINEILNSRKVNKTFPIYSEHSGTVKKKQIVLGDYVRTGSVLFEIQDLTRLWVVFDAYETDLPLLKLGNKISYSISGTSQIKETVISFIDPTINPQTRTAKVRGNISNISNKLKPEMFVSGSIDRPRSSEDIVTIPRSSVLWTGERSVIYVKNPDASVPTFEFREVVLGNTLGTNTQILEGLKLGEEVVTNGAFVIDASSQLNAQASMMNRNIKASDHEHNKHDKRGSAERFMVYGNCGMCEKTIESSLKNVEGVYQANWDLETKMINVDFDPDQINLDNIKQRIADAGYDTDTHRADENVYKALPDCCQFDRP